MSKWIFGSTTMALNPTKDTGWLIEPVVAEQHAIASTKSVLQSGGLKSGERQCEGITKSNTEHDALETLKNNQSTFTLVDEMGLSSSAQITAIKWEKIIDASNPSNYYVTWRYTITLRKRV